MKKKIKEEIRAEYNSLPRWVWILIIICLIILSPFYIGLLSGTLPPHLGG